MKKLFLTAVGILLLALPGQSQTVPHYVYIPQYHYIPSGGSTQPWEGHSLLNLSVGTGIFSRPYDDNQNVSDYSAHMPLSVALRYASEEDKGKHFFLGWYNVFDYYRFGFDYTYDGGASPYSFPGGGTSVGHDVMNSRTVWTVSLEEGVVVGCNFNKTMSLSLSAGFFVDLMSGSELVQDFVNRATGVSTYRHEDDGLKRTLFSSLGISASAEMRYFFSGPYFASLAVNMHFPLHTHDLDDPLGINRYSLLLGVGYKAFNKKSSYTDD